ncbi:MAG: hypothetical protein ACK6CU_27850 [Deltaproteobacteria bacterium]|jgi:tetratricopeptide (TPR) repeat protein
MRIQLLVLLGLVGCGGASPVRSVRVEETRVVASRGAGGETEVQVWSADVLFDEGNGLLRAGQCEQAVARYDTLVREFPSSRYVSASLYNAGLCLQEAHAWPASVSHYEQLLTLRPGSADEKHARLQLAEGLETLERWERGLENAEALLRRDDLSSAERLEALARRSRAVLGLGRLEDAARLAREATSYYRTRSGDEVIHDEYFAAMASYVLAETIRLRSEALAFPDGSVLEQHDVLDRRAALLLEAQRAYFDAIRLTNAHWAAASGYRIGGMYRAFFDAITQAPVPPPPRPMHEAQLALYRESYRSQLRDRVMPLVRHAIRYWELTLTMVERTGVESEWTARVREDLERTRALVLAATPAAAAGDSRERP